MTKRMLAMEWAMSVEEAIEAEAVAQALCMTTEDSPAHSAPLQPKRSRCSGRSLIDPSFLAWPFFEDRHRHFADSLNAWAQNEIRGKVDHCDVDTTCRALVRSLGEAGWLRASVPEAHGGLTASYDVRNLSPSAGDAGLYDGLADFAFAMQGLGTGPIALFASEEMKRHYLPPVMRGEAIAAFALSEPEAGSDVAAMSTTATPDGTDQVALMASRLGSRMVASPIICVFARWGEAPGARGLSAYIVDADTPGLTIQSRMT